MKRLSVQGCNYSVNNATTETVLTERLLGVFDRLLKNYGSQSWWPAESWFEMMAGAVLTQSTSWTNVEKAIANLKKANALSPSAIRQIDTADLTVLVYPSGFFNAKAKKLKALADFLGEQFNDDVELMIALGMNCMRKLLLGVHGIGEETADDILLYALEKPSFVIDAYTRRMFNRLGVITGNHAYSHHRDLFMENLPSDANLFGEYHALIVRHSKDTCAKRPECQSCCLLDLCPTGQQPEATKV